ncbi:polysaccharide biosynthesis C-terminal domain-containing protein [Pediococcus argentinicus]|uniref:oligosaccharide flippase family protein n=1 Tax=Pediococcus argentinicus TaxID=480391 RepID=UPI00338D74E0
MQIIKNYLYNAGYQIFILLIPLITTPYLARTIGPTGVGINAVTNSNIQYFILFGSIGISLYGNRQIAFVRENKDQLSKTFYEIFFLRLITITFAYLAFILFLAVNTKFKMYYFAQSFAIIAAAFDISWFFMGVENFRVTVLRNTLVKIITLVAIFTFVKSYNDLFTYILILSLSLLFGNLILFPGLRQYVSLPKFRQLNLKKHIKPSLVLFIPQIATQIYLVVNKTMLGQLAPIQQAGFFDQSDKIIKMVLAIVTASGTVMLPHVANAFIKGEHQKTKSFLYTSFQFSGLVSIPLMFGVAAVSRTFVPLFFGNNFLDVIPLMSVESIVILMIAWSNVIGVQYLLPTKQNSKYTKSVVIGAIINIIANVPLIIWIGALGATTATVISEVFVTIYQIWSIRNQIEYRYLFKNFSSFLIAGITMFIIVYYLNGIFTANWIMLALEVLIGIISYLLMLIVLKVKVIDIFNAFKNAD